MTLDELRDWHARRAGWNAPGTPIPNIWEPTTQAAYAEIAIKAWWKVDANFKVVATSHPFPATLDAADASMPKGWDWWRLVPIRTGEVTRWVAMCLADPAKGAMIDATTDKIRDLYELSKLAWEQEEA